MWDSAGCSTSLHSPCHTEPHSQLPCIHHATLSTNHDAPHMDYIFCVISLFLYPNCCQPLRPGSPQKPSCQMARAMSAPSNSGCGFGASHLQSWRTALRSNSSSRTRKNKVLLQVQARVQTSKRLSPKPKDRSEVRTHHTLLLLEGSARIVCMVCCIKP